MCNACRLFAVLSTINLGGLVANQTSKRFEHPSRIPRLTNSNPLSKTSVLGASARHVVVVSVSSTRLRTHSRPFARTAPNPSPDRPSPLINDISTPCTPSETFLTRQGPHDSAEAPLVAKKHTNIFNAVVTLHPPTRVRARPSTRIQQIHKFKPLFPPPARLGKRRLGCHPAAVCAHPTARLAPTSTLEPPSDVDDAEKGFGKGRYSSLRDIRLCGGLTSVTDMSLFGGKSAVCLFFVSSTRKEPDGWSRTGGRTARARPHNFHATTTTVAPGRSRRPRAKEHTFFRSCRGLEFTHVHRSLVRARARDVEDERCDGCRDDIGALQSRGARVRRAQDLGERRSVS